MDAALIVLQRLIARPTKLSWRHASTAAMTIALATTSTYVVSARGGYGGKGREIRVCGDSAGNRESTQADSPEKHEITPSKIGAGRIDAKPFAPLTLRGRISGRFQGISLSVPLVGYPRRALFYRAKSLP